QLSTLLEEGKLLHPTQMGFRPKHGTETALIAITEEAKKRMCNGFETAIILLDLSAAFDTVDLNILTTRLRGCGIAGTALEWISSYVYGRSFQVLDRSYISKRTFSTCGVPQGSALSPLLFNVYMRPLAGIVEPFGVKLVSYADDTQLVVSFSKARPDLGTALGPCLKAVATWMAGSKMKLDNEKTEVMFFGNNRPLAISSNLDGASTLPPPKSLIKSLGVWLDPLLAMAQHANRIAGTSFALLRMLRKVLMILPFLARRLVIQAVIGSRIDYGNALFIGSPKFVIQRLQRVQNAAARLLLNIPKQYSIRAGIVSLHWLPVAERIQFKA
ncbi:hypothetical protein NDU88_003005, partial [Pleurodeles waltl]